MRLEIDTTQEIDQKLQFLEKNFTGEIRCRSDEILMGLLLAKRTNKRLVYDEKAESLSWREEKNRDGLIVLEHRNDVSDIIAVNYAYAIDADMLFVKPIDRKEIHDLQRCIYEWRKNNSKEAYDYISGKIFERIGSMDFSRHQYVTFFTQGLPYGAILNNVVPMSHVFRSLREDMLIFNNIISERLDTAFNSALIFSPEEFDKEETRDLIDLLKSSNFYVKDLIGSKATVANLDFYGGHYPYDLLHICSHGGETDGYYVIEEFTDRTGKKHKIEYEEVVGFSRVIGDQVEVIRKAMFRMFNGFRWMSPELKEQNIPQYVFEDMRKALFGDKNGGKVIRVRADYPIFNSSHIKCYNSIHQGQFHVLASHSFPIIFNNTCSSWYEIATQVIAAGCRGYIGTLWNIKNNTAVNSAKIFYENLLNNNLLDVFYAMVKSIKNEQDFSVYIYWGLHFSSIKKPSTISKERILKELIRSLLAWVSKVRKTKIPEVKRKSIDITKFIHWEIVNNFRPEDLKDLKSEIEGAHQEIEKTPLPKEEDTDEMLSRGIIDIPNK